MVRLHSTCHDVPTDLYYLKDNEESFQFPLLLFFFYFLPPSKTFKSNNKIVSYLLLLLTNELIKKAFFFLTWSDFILHVTTFLPIFITSKTTENRFNLFFFFFFIFCHLPRPLNPITKVSVIYYYY